MKAFEGKKKSCAILLDSPPKDIQGGFAKAERLDQGYGDYQAIRLLADGEKPYVYVIAVRNQGKYLQLIEIYYPSLEHEKRYDKGVRKVLRGGAS